MRLAAGRQRKPPKSLTEEQTRDVLREASLRGPRDLAVVSLALFAAPRVGELVALDTDDVWVSERKGAMQIRYGKVESREPFR